MHLFLTASALLDDLGAAAQHEKQIGSRRLLLNHVLIKFEKFLRIPARATRMVSESLSPYPTGANPRD